MVVPHFGVLHRYLPTVSTSHVRDMVSLRRKRQPDSDPEATPFTVG